MEPLPATTSLRFRPMHRRDLETVYALETRCQSYPWPRWYLRKTLRGKSSGWLLEQDGKAIGFGIVDFTRRRAHILNMCVAPGYRQRGLGERIMRKLLQAARQRQARQVRLEVRETNTPAIRLYRKLGFHRMRIRKHYYLKRRGRENGIVMMRRL